MYTTKQTSQHYYSVGTVIRTLIYYSFPNSTCIPILHPVYLLFPIATKLYVMGTTLVFCSIMESFSLKDQMC